ncbi:RNA polymerase ECF-type sigma factor [Arcticibacter svalbardensis MN12-7]|uniref:RNA polymerase ECF-type sigma factor n=1 Tax=Arcticibacter svalbardensis MN12-7 TaxID=1150600 RepID=R9GY17_9SPHI|nr:sigma-70 family RNA polymerase sigma factor [Arcticibacter svalbardensis]EOR96405.1 RNA polymerase ECF-type sigma factor [Arcticibacter svalbardensis MN12-7]
MPSDNNETLAIENTINPHLWVIKYADYLYNYAITRVNDEEQARDLIQDTFLAALNSMNKFEGKCSERTWLTSILKNKVIDVYRKNSVAFIKNKVIDQEEEEHDYFNHEYGNWNIEYRPKEFGIEQSDALENKEFQHILKLCMKKLPSLWLAVFTMKHMDDETTEKICKELKVSSSNFWVVIHRAKVNLRACLQKNWIQT